VHKWMGLLLIIIGTQVVAADGNEPRVVYVKESKSLWSVALAVKPTEVRMWQAVMALYEQNPDAFYDNDVNKLKDNVTLVVPSSEVMLSLTEAEALVRFQLLGDQPQPNLDKVTLDTPSKTSVAPKVELTIDESVAAINLSKPDNTQESTEDKAQNLTTLNQQDETPVETSCLLLTCNPKTISVVDDRGFSNVGDVYVSAGVSNLRNYSAYTRWGFSGDTSLNHVRGKNGFEVNVGYLWRDGIIFELGYNEANSDLYRKEYSNNTTYNYGPNEYTRISHKLVSISPKILFSTDFGKQVSLYSGVGVGWIKDAAYYDENVTNTSDKGTSHGGLYQILLGSKILLEDDFFVDLRIQNKHFLSRTFSSSGVLNGQMVKKYDTVDTVLSIGRAL
jgi:FimV-like protein